MTDNILHFSATLDRDNLLAGQAMSKVNCHVSIKPTVPTSNENATRASICLVFDCSYSMAGDKFNTAVNTAKMIIDIIHERHCISMVAFNTDSHVLFKNTIPSIENEDAIKKKVDNLKSHLGGSTNMAAGIKKGMDILLSRKFDANIIIILSDGEPNSPSRAQIMAETASQENIQIFAVGIGDAYDADQLLRLVTPSNGAVFGDSNGDNIDEIFYDIINRIDRICAHKVKLNFDFDQHAKINQVFKISPERALYDSSKIIGDKDYEIRVGNIENNKDYEFLLQIHINEHDLGSIELINLRLEYSLKHLGKNIQKNEAITLKINFTENNTIRTTANNRMKNAIESATMVQLSDEIMQTCTNSNNSKTLHAIDELQSRCNDENNTELHEQLESLKARLVRGKKISDKERNDFVVASTIAPVKTTIFDLVLVDPGTQTIRLLREIRFATNLGLRDIKNIIRNKNSVVTEFESKPSAVGLQQRLKKIGADAVIHARERVEQEE